MKLLRTMHAGAFGILLLSAPALSAQGDPQVQEVVRLAKAKNWTGALHSAEEIRDPSLRALALCNLAKRQLIADERGKAKKTFEAILPSIGEIDDTFARTKAIGFLAELQLLAGDSIRGKATFDRALREAASTRDARGAIGALVDVAQRRYRIGDQAGGRTTFVAATALAPKLDTVQERIALLMHIDKILEKLGDRDARKVALAAAVPFASQIADLKVRFKVLLSLGDKQLAIEDREGFAATLAVARKKARAMSEPRARARITMIVAERLFAAGLRADARWVLRDLTSHLALLKAFAKKPEYSSELQANADTILAYALLQIEVDDLILGWAFLRDATTHMRVKTDQILERALAGLIWHKDWSRALEATVLLATLQPDRHRARLDVVWRGSLDAADYETADLTALQYRDLQVHFERRLELTRHLAQTGEPTIAKVCLAIAEKLCTVIETAADIAQREDPSKRPGTSLNPFPDLHRRALCVEAWINLNRHDDASLAVERAIQRALTLASPELRVDALLSLADAFQDLDLSTQQPACWAAATTEAKDAKLNDELIGRIADSQAFAGELVAALQSVNRIWKPVTRLRCRSRIWDRSIAAYASSTERLIPVADRIKYAESFPLADQQSKAMLALALYYSRHAITVMERGEKEDARLWAVDASAVLTSGYKPALANAAAFEHAASDLAELWIELGDEERAAALRSR